jgi:hypothetical protein
MHVTDSACYTNNKTLRAGYHRPWYTSSPSHHRSKQSLQVNTHELSHISRLNPQVCILSGHIAPKVRASVTPPGRYRISVVPLSRRLSTDFTEQGTLGETDVDMEIGCGAVTEQYYECYTKGPVSDPIRGMGLYVQDPG